MDEDFALGGWRLHLFIGYGLSVSVLLTGGYHGHIRPREIEVWDLSMIRSWIHWIALHRAAQEPPNQ